MKAKCLVAGFTYGKVLAKDEIFDLPKQLESMTADEQVEVYGQQMFEPAAAAPVKEQDPPVKTPAKEPDPPVKPPEAIKPATAPDQKAATDKK